jgi:RNA polymerase sigma-70 factor (ECF subfamily)
VWGDVSDPFALAPANGDSDADLLKRFRQGDEQAANHLVDRYGGRIRALAEGHCGQDLAARVDPEDIVQSVFRCFFIGAARGRYQLAEEEHLWRLLLVMTLNKVRSIGDYHRAAKRDVRLTSSRQVLHTLSSDTTEQELADLRLLIEEVLEQFPEKARSLIRLRLEGHEVSEVAQRTGVSKRTVERILQDFRHILRDKMTAP